MIASARRAARRCSSRASPPSGPPAGPPRGCASARRARAPRTSRVTPPTSSVRARSRPRRAACRQRRCRAPPPPSALIVAAGGGGGGRVARGGGRGAGTGLGGRQRARPGPGRAGARRARVGRGRGRGARRARAARLHLCAPLARRLRRRAGLRRGRLPRPRHPPRALRARLIRGAPRRPGPEAGPAPVRERARARLGTSRAGPPRGWQVDLPWLVSYEGQGGAGQGVRCSGDAQRGSFSENVECMRQARAAAPAPGRRQQPCAAPRPHGAGAAGDRGGRGAPDCDWPGRDGAGRTGLRSGGTPPPSSYQSDTPRPSPRTNRTRRVPHPGTGLRSGGTPRLPVPGVRGLGVD